MKNAYSMIDIAEIKVHAGDGGDGKVSFLRQKFVPKGGPDGGDGGKGGNVYLVADNNMTTLIDFRARPNYDAQNGQIGGKKDMFGSDGEDLHIKVPVGTLIYEKGLEEDTLVCDMNSAGQEFLIARGGMGGKGNAHFKSSTNQTPLQYTKGGKGEVKTLKLEVKMVADIGLIGFPNAGKSTLLNKLTKASAKVANYPFTTLSPNLGTLRLKNGRDIVISDIPGVIEGASEGRGLGDEFLRHIERTRILVHLIDPLGLVDYSPESLASEDPNADLVANSVKMYDVIRGELEEYGKGLTSKPEIVVINKLDLTEVKDAFSAIKEAFAKRGLVVFGISGVTGEGTMPVLDKILEMLSVLPQEDAHENDFEIKHAVRIYRIGDLPNKKVVYNTSIWENDRV